MQTLSGQLPWSEIKNSTIIIIKLYEKCLPQRPESLPMFDAHWNFIMLCMSLVAEFRPSVVEVLEWVNGVISSREFPCLALSYISLVSLLSFTDCSAGPETESPHPGLHMSSYRIRRLGKFPCYTLTYISLISLLSFTGCSVGPETESPHPVLYMSSNRARPLCKFPCYTLATSR